MSLTRRIANRVLPPTQRFAEQSLLTLNQVKAYPFATPFAREMIGLEWRKSNKPIQELRTFTELLPSAWRGLGSFAYQLVLHERPKVIVELGTHMGFSALTMGLALRELGQGGKLFAIDCWDGDPQAGYYGDEVYNTFLERRETLDLDSTIIPLRMFFDEARDKVATPIDILHIDGLHTLEAVSHDFETFGPLVRPGGLILFHDVNTHFIEVREFWAKLSPEHDSYTVPYSHGLGILRT